MHALVTGGGGFLGGYIVKALLARGDRVRSFGRGDYPALTAKSVEVVRGDIRDNAVLATACAGIDCVFHAAALAGIGMDRDAYESVNRFGTELLLASARRCGVARFVYTSSPSVVFAGEDQCGIDERAPYDFAWMESSRAFYSYTKACAEQAVLAANGDGIHTCSIRPHLIWGPGDTHLVPRLLARRGLVGCGAWATARTLWTLPMSRMLRKRICVPRTRWANLAVRDRETHAQRARRVEIRILSARGNR